MKYPKLVNPKMCNTDVTVQLTDGICEDGSPNNTIIFKGKCCYSEKSKQIVSPDKQLIRLEATALFDGDIAPDIFDITGEVFIEGRKAPRLIYRSSKARNPDGTVNFTCLELM